MSRTQVFLFLDFDGVLHGQRYGSPLFVHVPVFEAVVRPFIASDQLAIVISSSWRNTESLTRMRKRFSPDIASSIVDVTPNLNDSRSNSYERLTLAQLKAAIDDPNDASAGLRQREIMAWMVQHAPGSAWLALDDMADYFAPDCHNLVLTDAMIGLTPTSLKRLQTLLTLKISS